MTGKKTGTATVSGTKATSTSGASKMGREYGGPLGMGSVVFVVGVAVGGFAVLMA